MSGTEKTKNAFHWREQPSVLVEKPELYKVLHRKERQARVVRHVDAVSTAQCNAYSRATPAKAGA